MGEKVVIGLSGGVDSSVAACLLKKQGYDVIGVTLKTWQENETENTAVTDAKRVAEHLQIPFYVLDASADFKREVVDYFTDAYIHGKTPNPCCVCNRKLKWGALLSYAKTLEADYIATGHYARIEQLENGRFAIRNSVTASKDQTYALYNLTQDQLAHTMMPVGEYEKDAIREIARTEGIPVAEKADSMEICFIPDHDYAAFLERQVPATEKIPGPGNFVDAEGKILGKHLGITHYTVGQRKGLNLAIGHPIFVTAIRPETNEVVIGENEDVFTDTLYCDQMNFMAVEDIEEPKRLLAKIRYAHKGDYCLLEKENENRYKVTFEKKVRAVTPGQAVVFYEGEHVFGGGTII
ncbi:MAG: tRNA 2-thiouridine(34) synthase MnmA [Lachnospiraceae bacterium]|nr:tRNA 2-thiouridine(34) synthase MnmA [Lachnospiraceae bacterium]